jgi:hypothetical protein
VSRESIAFLHVISKTVFKNEIKEIVVVATFKVPAPDAADGNKVGRYSRPWSSSQILPPSRAQRF